jgi:hypothetical protein
VTDPQAGQPARRFHVGRFLPEREVIGPLDCPILHRYTLVSRKGRFGFKLMLHRFQPNADDRAVHDHPASFVTIVLQGGYEDLVPCGDCDGHGTQISHENVAIWDCGTCRGGGLVLGDRMRPCMVRFRPATYRHVTKVGPRGCTTLVLMGPKRRPWGFWLDGEWWPWRMFEFAFGLGMRCGDDDDA